MCLFENNVAFHEKQKVSEEQREPAAAHHTITTVRCAANQPGPWQAQAAGHDGITECTTLRKLRVVQVYNGPMRSWIIRIGGRECGGSNSLCRTLVAWLGEIFEQKEG